MQILAIVSLKVCQASDPNSQQDPSAVAAIARDVEAHVASRPNHSASASASLFLASAAASWHLASAS